MKSSNVRILAASTYGTKIAVLPFKKVMSLILKRLCVMLKVTVLTLAINVCKHFKDAFHISKTSI
jgi:hypothetical protein